MHMNIKQLRIAKGLTQNQCAELLGISRRGYQNLEKDDANTKTEKYQNYCKIINNYRNENLNFQTNVVVGNDLLMFYERVKRFKKRYCYDYLLQYIRKDYYGKIAILYGLRRTGKTTMLFQLLKDIDYKKAAYIKIKDSDSIAMLIKDINLLKDNGYKYVLIDEITLLDDFISTAATLSDIYAMMGMKIVLSGTDSLGFAFTDNNELYDRNISIHTSYISFKEFSYLTDIDDIDQYIEYGGTLKAENMSFDDPDYLNEEVAFRDDESTRKYIDTAISRNIQRSLKNYKNGDGFANLKKLYEQGELTNIINRIIENMNHEFLINVIDSKFKSSDLGSARQLLLHNKDDKIQTALYDIDVEKVTTQLKEIIDIKEKEELKNKVDQKIMDQIKKYLLKLDLIQEVDVFYEDNSSEKRVIFTQPGMRYAITKALIYSLFEDAYFHSLTNKQKDIIIDKIISDVKGRMLEDIVLLEMHNHADNNHLVFKYKTFMDGEIDVVNYDKYTYSLDVYEVKHSDKIIYEQQSKYLNNPDTSKNLIKLYGVINQRYILYRGLDKEIENIKYLNVEKFLKSL